MDGRTKRTLCRQGNGKRELILDTTAMNPFVVSRQCVIDEFCDRFPELCPGDDPTGILGLISQAFADQTGA